MNNSTLQKFINLYQLSKTLRFELKPVGKTELRKYHNKTLSEVEKSIKKKNNYNFTIGIISTFIYSTTKPFKFLLL